MSSASLTAVVLPVLMTLRLAYVSRFSMSNRSRKVCLKYFRNTSGLSKEVKTIFICSLGTSFNKWPLFTGRPA